MKVLPAAMAALIEQFGKMPGIGPRSAERLTFYILKSSVQDINFLLRSIKEVKEKVKSCDKCNNLSERDLCNICSDTKRDHSKICVVENPGAVIAMEKSGFFDGVYHVLLGAISPIDGVGPDELKIKELIERVKSGKIKEIIIATDFTTEGETTALYLKEILKKFDFSVTRLAHGVPVGATLEHADVATLERAFEGRNKV